MRHRDKIFIVPFILLIRGKQMNNYNTIIDFISGEQIKATPEEVDAVQVFSRQLVDDYGYPRENIQTRPQYRVKQRPSGKADFPVDIMVFTSKNHDFENEYIIVECTINILSRCRIFQLE